MKDKNNTEKTEFKTKVIAALNKAKETRSQDVNNVNSYMAINA
jgi:hypothetical protein